MGSGSDAHNEGGPSDLPCKLVDMVHIQLPNDSPLVMATFFCEEFRLASSVKASTAIQDLFGDQHGLLRSIQLSPVTWMMIRDRHDDSCGNQDGCCHE